jgi:hypothetical protein
MLDTTSRFIYVNPGFTGRQFTTSISNYRKQADSFPIRINAMVVISVNRLG